MGDIVNLNKARKATTKAKKTAKAAENRTKHGQSKAERERHAAKQTLATHILDGKKRESPENSGDESE